MKHITTVTFSEACDQIELLLAYMEKNSFDERQIISVKLAQNALINFELLKLISLDTKNDITP